MAPRIVAPLTAEASKTSNEEKKETDDKQNVELDWKDLYNDEFEEGDHAWHWRYNRRLSCVSHAISNLIFSQDSRYLVSGTAFGDATVWDTGCWAEAAKLKGCCKRETPRALSISPAQRWLVVAYAKVLHIFNCKPPWKLEQSLQAQLDASTGNISEWKCCAFSPMAEVDHPAGHAGQDNHLAVFSNSALCVVDYSGGWGEDAPRRTRSLMQSGMPTMSVYTACGSFLIAGFGSGVLQIWNTASLTHVKTLSAHQDCVLGLAASPNEAAYAPRLVSCSVDQTLRVWHSACWVLEQHVHDTRCDRNGVRKVVFSPSGQWLLSVANMLCVWRVNITKRGRLLLTLHQRLSAVCGAEGLSTAAFSRQDALAVGSRDGVLGLWIKCAGLPADPAEDAPTSPVSAVPRRLEPRGAERMILARPMQKVTTGGIRPQTRQFVRSDWHRRSTPNNFHRNILGSSGGLLCNTPPGSAGHSSVLSSNVIVRSATMPNFRQRRSEETVLKNLGLHGRDPNIIAAPVGNDFAEVESPIRKTMQHACRRGLVQRISLDPKIITTDE